MLSRPPQERAGYEDVISLPAPVPGIVRLAPSTAARTPVDAGKAPGLDPALPQKIPSPLPRRTPTFGRRALRATAGRRGRWRTGRRGPRGRGLPPGPSRVVCGRGVESTTGAVAVGGGGSCSRRLSPMPVPHSSPWLRFQSPLVEPDVRISRIRLSDEIMPSPTGSSPYAAQGA